MNRRTFILAGASALAVAAGCTDDDTNNTDHDVDDRGGLIGPWHVEIHPAIDVPDDATVLHAEDDDHTDLEILQELHQEANEEYDPEMDDDIDEDQPLRMRTPLVRREVTDEEAQAVEDILDRDRWHGGHTWYVEFFGTTFIVRTEPPDVA